MVVQLCATVQHVEVQAVILVTFNPASGSSLARLVHRTSIFALISSMSALHNAAVLSHALKPRLGSRQFCS